jgi:fructokinase
VEPPGRGAHSRPLGELRAARRVLISYDPNVRPAVMGARERGVGIVEQAVRHAHVVKASREDVDWLYPELTVDDVAARWTRLGAELVVVTDGPDGASAYRRAGEPVRRPARRVTVIDTIGAGDTFTSGLLTGLVRRRLHGGRRLEGLSDGTLADIIDEAVLVAAITCEREGADPPGLEQLDRLLRSPTGPGNDG